MTGEQKPLAKASGEKGFVKSATRVLDLFEHLRRWDRRMTHTDFAEQLGIPKSSLTQLLHTLVSRRYLSFDPVTKTYGLGKALADLAERSAEGRDLLSIAKDVLPGLALDTGESCGMHVPAGSLSRIAIWQSGNQRLQYTMEVGETAPLYSTAGGKVLLAFMGREAIEQYVAGTEMRPITPKTTVSREKLLEDLEQIRRTGVAIVREEHTIGICAIARPILNAEDEPVGGLNISVPSVRFDEVFDLCMNQLEKYASIITYRLRE